MPHCRPPYIPQILCRTSRRGRALALRCTSSAHPSIQLSRSPDKRAASLPRSRRSAPLPPFLYARHSRCSAPLPLAAPAALLSPSRYPRCSRCSASLQVPLDTPAAPLRSAPSHPVSAPSRRSAQHRSSRSAQRRYLPTPHGAEISTPPPPPALIVDSRSVHLKAILPSIPRLPPWHGRLDGVRERNTMAK
jgi:hypothetical protein